MSEDNLIDFAQALSGEYRSEYGYDESNAIDAYSDEVPSRSAKIRESIRKTFQEYNHHRLDMPSISEEPQGLHDQYVAQIKESLESSRGFIRLALARHQLEGGLGSPRQFILKAQTVSLIRSAVGKHLSSGYNNQDILEVQGLVQGADDRLVSELVKNRISLMFASLARQLVRGKIYEFAITEERQLSETIGQEINHRIPFPSREYSKLYDELYHLMLYPGIRRELSGDWGHVCLRQDGELHLDIQMQPSSDTPQTTAYSGIDDF